MIHASNDATDSTRTRVTQNLDWNYFCTGSYSNDTNSVLFGGNGTCNAVQKKKEQNRTEQNKAMESLEEGK